MRLLAARAAYANATEALVRNLESWHGAPRGDSQAVQARHEQVWAGFQGARAEYDAALLAELTGKAVPAGRTPEFVEQLKSLAENLRGVHAPAAASHDSYQPYQSPPLKKKPMPQAIECACKRPKHSDWRFGTWALGGAAAGTLGWIGLGAMGMFGAMPAILGVASLGFLGAGMYGTYKLTKHIFSAHPAAQGGHNPESWWQQAYGPAVQPSGPAAVQYEGARHA